MRALTSLIELGPAFVTTHTPLRRAVLKMNAIRNVFFSVGASICAVFLVLAGASFARAQAEDATTVPWGISSSASAWRNHAEWFPRMSEAGVAWVRLFPE